jgi:catechol 2,3-dioxygenase-like lactoylglutathione lyase family enzyme
LAHFRRVTPRLPVADLGRSLAFWRDVLGFDVDVLWPEREPTFAILERDQASIGLFSLGPHHGRGTIGYAEIYLEAEDVRELHDTLRGQLPIEWGPEVYSYGRREFAVRDPDGYLVIFTEPTDDPPTTEEP